ncbi:MAG: hypothetical protein ACE5H8_00220 [Alphaproteobacteria bacterium]
MRIGEILVDRGLITSAQLAAALSEQRGTGEKIGEVLLRRGLVRPHDLQHSLAHQSRMLMAAAALAVGGMLSPSLGGASANSAAESAAIAAPTDAAAVATLTAVTGSVRVLAPGGKTKNVRAGMAIRLGDRVTTDAAARAVVAFLGGGVLVMRDAGTLVIDETLLGDDRTRDGTVAGAIESAFRYLSDLVGVSESRRVVGIAPTIGIRG